MRIWIDASQSGTGFCVFHMTLLERQLRALQSFENYLIQLEDTERKMGDMVQAVRELRHLAEARIRPTEVWIELPEGVSPPADLPDDLTNDVPIRWMNEGGSVRERLQRSLVDAAGEPVLAFSGDTVVDPRMVELLAWWSDGSAVFLSDENEKSGAAMRLEAPLPEGCTPDDDFLEIGRAAVQIGAAKRLHDEEMDLYITKLRRKLPPYVFRVRSDKTREEVERFLFWSNYKGSTDFLTKFVYPPLVWALLKPLVARRVKPNTVTAVGIAACVLSVPFFAAGMWVPGLILAYVMSVLDSVDGKLARLTFQSSPQGDVLDHATDYIHPPFWYAAWAWGLSGGVASSGLFVASLWMTVFYILDRVMEVLFKACTGSSVHGYTRFDAKVRTIISRRNVNLAIFSIALPLGLGEPAIYFMAAWQGASFLFHLGRVVSVWNARNGLFGTSRHLSPARRETRSV